MINATGKKIIRKLTRVHDGSDAIIESDISETSNQVAEDAANVLVGDQLITNESSSLFDPDPNSSITTQPITASTSPIGDVGSLNNQGLKRNYDLPTDEDSPTKKPKIEPSVQDYPDYETDPEELHPSTDQTPDVTLQPVDIRPNTADHVTPVVTDSVADTARGAQQRLFSSDSNCSTDSVASISIHAPSASVYTISSGTTDLDISEQSSTKENISVYDLTIGKLFPYEDLLSDDDESILVFSTTSTPENHHAISPNTDSTISTGTMNHGGKRDIKPLLHNVDEVAGTSGGDMKGKSQALDRKLKDAYSDDNMNTAMDRRTLQQHHGNEM
jgi:hypothetical protein